MRQVSNHLPYTQPMGAAGLSTPRLVAISGPLKGAVFPVASGEFTVGRDSANALCLDDAAVSRWHCRISGAGAEFALTDLKSRNGTLVNGERIKTCALENCDEIAIGASLFVFLITEDAPAPQPRHVDDDALTRTIVLQPEQSLFLSPSKLSAALGETRLARDLNTLLQTANGINRQRTPKEFHGALTKAIFESFPAACAGIFLGEQILVASASGDRMSASHALEKSARSACNERLSILEQADSILAVPIATPEGVIGSIAVEANIGQRFDRDHLELLSAIAAMAASPLDNAIRLEYLQNENERLQSETITDHAMVGESPRFRELLAIIAKAAPSDTTVLIRGESGTGKELVARAIHANSARAGKPFVAINCASLSETLLESDLFGHEKGAFTGAVAQKKGKLEVADGGTVFLDEVGELPPSLQARLLRVLQEREFERVGGTRPIKASIRLIAATNRNLEEAVKSGEFRQDFFYRLNVIKLTTPPLRERREDIGPLAAHFVQKYSHNVARKIAGISPAARAYLKNYDWPGNVRELENAIEHAVVLGSSEWILPEDLPDAIVDSETPAGVLTAKYHAGVKEAKKRLILSALDEAGGSQTGAAKSLGVNPTYLSRLIRNLNLKTSSARD
jgi:transcriptional regulator with GAF, ATPase, and Fis domain